MSNYWIPPLPGQLKLNIDESFWDLENCMGGGVLFRDDRGSWVAGFTGAKLGVSPFLVEAMAKQYGLTMAWDRGERNLICESTLIEAVYELDMDQALRVIGKIKELMAKDLNIVLRRIPHECNNPAEPC